MKLIKSKKGLVLLATLAVAVAASIGAYAYFTSGGSGTGTASVGTSDAFVLHGSATDPLYPGTSSDVTFTVDNPGNGQQYLATIHLASVDACSVAWDYSSPLGPQCGANAPGGGGDIASCGGLNSTSSDFQMDDVTVNHDYAPGSGWSVTPLGSLHMNDLSTPQDSCKGAFLNLNLTSS